MNKNLWAYMGGVIFLIFFGMPATQAAPISVQCPETLDVNQTAAAVGDWQVATSSDTHAFLRLKIYNGNPSGKVSLDPDNADEQPSNYRWTLGDAGDSLWVECSYRGSTTRLIQQLPKGLHSCEAEKKNHLAAALTCE